MAKASEAVLPGRFMPNDGRLMSLDADLADWVNDYTRLSHWFGFHDTVLAWITFYHHSRTFSVSTNGSVYGTFPISFAFPAVQYSPEPSCSG